MSLLNKATYKLNVFIQNILDYAIVSHTWNKEEVILDHTIKPHTSSMKGLRNIVESC